LVSYTKAEDECNRGACHPTTGNLLVGRSTQLMASSTCGLNGAQKYCILSYLETFRPAAMLVERSADYGRTWKVLKYFAKDCATSFPNITSGQAQGVGDLVCDSKYSDIEPSTGGEVVLKVLDPSFEIENPYSPYIQACSCNGHSDRCHFDMNVYLASGGVSGGVCEDCRHNTEGPHCDRCRPLFYRDPLKAISDPYACLPCECDPDGTVSGGICVSHSDPALEWVAGQCLCKENVEGAKCDQCKPNYYGLSATDPKGCQPCNCNPFGSLPLSTCDVDTGHCLCKPFAIGPHCEDCTVGYWGLENHPHGCVPCDCDIGGAYSNMCSPKDGQCECRPHVIGRSCTEPAPGYFFAPLNFYLYEAEEATPLQGLAPLVPAPHVVLRDPGMPVTWTGRGLARVLTGDGLRFAVNNIPFPMDFTMAIRYEAQSTADWAVQIVVNPPGGSEYCTRKTPPQKPHSFALPAASRKRWLASAATGACRAILDFPTAALAIVMGLLNFVIQRQDRASTAGGLQLEETVKGKQCEECSAGFYGNPRISGAPCRPCACNNNIDITDPESCSQVTGECLKCLHNTQGPNCQLCKPGHFGSALNQTCRSYDGKHCSDCKEDYYGDPLERCIACDCNREGTQRPICDGDTGMCRCREGISGQQCDRCARGHGQEFPACPLCHLCFDQWDHSISSLSRAVQGLIRLAANMEDKRETLPVCDANFKGLKKNMSEIERILKHPVFSSEKFLKVKDYHDSVGKQIMQLSEQLKAVYAFPDLKETIVKMRNEADLLLENLQEETDLLSSVRNTSIMDFSENIKKYYQRSLSAEKKTNGTTSIISNSEKIRNDLLTILDTLTSKANLSLENLKQIKIPDIQILKEKVCGEPGDVPCVLSTCGGPSCRDSLTLSGNAFQKAQEAESMIYNLSNQVQGWKNQIKNISKLAEVSKNNTLQLSEKLRNMKNQSESEKEKMHLLIKKLKKFLSEENVPPEDIEKVANHVLNVHLPITSQNLTQELDKIWKFMQLCEDYRTDEDKLNKTADGVRKVLVKAKAAEKSGNVLLNLDKMLNKLQQVQITQERANSTITQLTAEITKIKKNILQAENQAKETKNELDLAKQQSALEDGLSQLRIKLQRNQEQAIHAETQAEPARRQAGSLEEKFVELQTQYAVLQHKTSATGLAKETLGKVKQLKDAAEKLARETEDKIRRITDLEKKIQDLNISRQEKADQLKQLEDQVIGIKNEIDEQENKYATC
ncbi:Laminin subunit beta-4, partial [Pteropus alecto]